MVKKSESIALQSEGGIPKPDKILASMDWEQRLAVARAQRAQIQAEQSNAYEERATDKSASLYPTPRDNPSEHPTSASKGNDSRTPSKSDKSSDLDFRKRILGAEVVPESMGWEDRIAKIREQRQGNQAKQTTDVKPTATSAEPIRSRISGWRTVAGFGVGVVFGLGIASSDVVKDAVLQIRIGFSVAPSDPPNAVTQLDVSQLPNASPTESAPLVTMTASPPAIDTLSPGLLAVPASPALRSAAKPLQALARPDPWRPPKIEIQTAMLSDAPPRHAKSSQAPSFAAPVPNLADPVKSNAQRLALEPVDWFRTAPLKPGFLHLAVPSGLPALVEAAPIPSIKLPILTASIASFGGSSVPALQERNNASKKHASSLAKLAIASIASALPARPAALTSPRHGYQMSLNADASPPAVSKTERPAYAVLVPALADPTASKKRVFDTEPEDWFRMATLKPVFLPRGAPVGFALSDGGSPKPSVVLPALSTVDRAITSPAALALQAGNIDTLPDHFSTRPEAPEFVARSAPIETLEPKPRPLFSQSEPFAAAASVLVHILATSDLPDDRLDSVSGALINAGFSINEPVRVSFTVKQSNVRFFSAQDADAARALAEIVGGTARDFTSYSPSPPKGTIEVWLAGAKSSNSRAAKAAPLRAKPVRGKTNRNKAEQDKVRLRNKLLNQLRSGDHL